nr:PREDICTED: LOW QUALITY PROTEIN: long-chain-fatty-acid--CoA ligase ACSBG2-like [Apteryx mantelli mantelli]
MRRVGSRQHPRAGWAWGHAQGQCWAQDSAQGAGEQQCPQAGCCEHRAVGLGAEPTQAPSTTTTCTAGAGPSTHGPCKPDTGHPRSEGSAPWGFRLPDSLVLQGLQQELGLDRCRYRLAGAAPMARKTLNFFLSLGLPLYEMYGLSESSRPHTYATAQAYLLLSCGKEMKGCQSRVDQQDTSGTGELCIWGRHVFMGYLNLPEQMQEALDGEGWLHTGDLCCIDQEGFIFITGRPTLKLMCPAVLKTYHDEIEQLYCT